MVLANRLIGTRQQLYPLLLLGTALTAMAQTTDQAVVAGRALQLHTGNGHCVVRDEKAKLQLPTQLAAPCHFVLRENGHLQSFHYAKKGTVAIIVAAPATRDAIAPWPAVTLADQCATQAQGIIIHNGKLALSAHKARDGLFCPNISLDEKVFYGFAHPFGVGSTP